LSSISGLENVTVEQQVDMNTERNVKDETRLQDIKEVNEPQTEIHRPQTVSKEETVSAANDPVYAKFFRMIQVGVPVEAVRLKMQAEGHDPSILE
jgi:WASH complex subunit CCDC53